MSFNLQQQQHSLVGTMAQAVMDLLHSFTNCIFCFPGSPQLKINSRSFKMQHLLGEARFPLSLSLSDQTLCRAHRLTTYPVGRVFLCLLSSGYLYVPTLCTEEDQMPLWSRVRCAGTERSRSLHSILSSS